jgi:hypothetical protein
MASDARPVPDPVTRVAALVVPLLLLGYGAARYVDGLDGSHGPGTAWTIGHLAFLAAMLGFGALAVGLGREGRRGPWPALAGGGLLATLVGVGLFCWVILTDLSARLEDVAALPDALMTLGPLAFGGGLVTLLALQVGRWLPWWSPFAIVGAIAALGADLDLLAAAALLFALGLWPLVRRSPRAAVPAGEAADGYPAARAAASSSARSRRAAT